VNSRTHSCIEATRFENCYFDAGSCIPRLRLEYANSTLVKITVFKPCRFKHTREFCSYHKLIPHVMNYFCSTQCNLLLLCTRYYDIHYTFLYIISKSDVTFCNYLSRGVNFLTSSREKRFTLQFFFRKKP